MTADVAKQMQTAVARVEQEIASQNGRVEAIVARAHSRTTASLHGLKVMIVVMSVLAFAAALLGQLLGW